MPVKKQKWEQIFISPKIVLILTNILECELNFMHLAIIMYILDLS